MSHKTLPEIITDFDAQSSNPAIKCYLESISHLIHDIFPENFFQINWDNPSEVEALRVRFEQLIPYTHVSKFKKLPTTISFTALYKCRAGAFKFFFEMISRWLVPGTCLNVVSLFARDLKIPRLSKDVFTLCDVMIHLENQNDQKEIERSLPIIDQEIKLGVKSFWDAQRILETKGVSNDVKTTMVHEQIAYLSNRLSALFHQDLIMEMQHLLVMCNDKFKHDRSVRHLSRLICLQYLFRRGLQEALQKGAGKRYLFLKTFRASVQSSMQQKPVVALLVGMNFLQETESFEEKHLIKAIRHYIPKAKTVDNSLFYSQRAGESFQILYLEIEKGEGELFTKREIDYLRKDLPKDLEAHIEKRMPLVFMPRNEEEVMRNILSLCNQLRFVRDIPQVIITFDEQSQLNLIFTIILARVHKKEDLSIQELFKKSKTQLRYIHDRRKKVGHLRNKYDKEATVFRVKMPKEPFSRRDHSIDLFKARRVLVEELTRIFGEFRDFNGGMILKQSELLMKVRNCLGDEVKFHELLLENFFYSLQPAVMQTILEPEGLSTLFLMLLNAIENSSFEGATIRQEPHFVYLLFKEPDPQIEDDILKIAQSLKIESTELASSYIKVYDKPYLGYIYRCDDPALQVKFCSEVESAVQSISGLTEELV